MRLASSTRFAVESPRVHLWCLNLRHISLQIMEKACAQILGNKYNASYLYSILMFTKLFINVISLALNGTPVGQVFLPFLEMR